MGDHRRRGKHVTWSEAAADAVSHQPHGLDRCIQAAIEASGHFLGEHPCDLGLPVAAVTIGLTNPNLFIIAFFLR